MRVGRALMELERKMAKMTGHRGIQGTILFRVVDEKGCLVWSVGLGLVNEPKVYWHGKTIQQAIRNAMADVDKDLKDNDEQTAGA